MDGCSTSHADPIHCPGMGPPDGIRPMNPNADTKEVEIAVIYAICIAVIIVAVLIRFFVKVFLLKVINTEDWWMGFAAVGSMIMAGFSFKSSSYGKGRHSWDVSLANTMDLLRIGNMAQITYCLVMLAAKTAVLLQIKRIFALERDTIAFWIVIGLMGCNAALYITTFFLSIFTCWPREKIWNPMIPGSCMNARLAVMFTSTINIISDFTILALPIYFVFNLQLPRKRKFGVSAVFAIGMFACIASIFRLVYGIRFLRMDDLVYWLLPMGLWSLAELTTVMLCVCLPTFPCFYAFLRGERPNTSKYSQSSARNRGQSFSNKKASAASHDKVDSDAQDMGSYLGLDEINVGSTSAIVKSESQEYLGKEVGHEERLDC